MRGHPLRRHRSESANRGQKTAAALLSVVGVAVALGVGIIGGYALSRTRFDLPDVATLSEMLAPVASDPVAASLFAGALGVLVVPFGMYVVYQLFFLTDR